jgi:hypothetical protein
VFFAAAAAAAQTFDGNEIEFCVRAATSFPRLGHNARHVVDERHRQIFFFSSTAK